MLTAAKSRKCLGLVCIELVNAQCSKRRGHCWSQGRIHSGVRRSTRGKGAAAARHDLLAPPGQLREGDEYVVHCWSRYGARRRWGCAGQVAMRSVVYEVHGAVALRTACGDELG